MTMYLYDVHRKERAAGVTKNPRLTEEQKKK